ncbi:hypothetical protein C8F01DRAFT_1207034 [Mycena amicta]|nr:hypothetical protein C8F01DRAFT_1207034 [Mycena amicta]
MSKHVLTDEQRLMYRSEKLMNFRWIATILATHAPYTLTSRDVATPEVQDYISDIGQFAEIVPPMPLEGYNCVRGAKLIASFVGSTAHLPGYIAYRQETQQLIMAIAGTGSATQAIQDLRALMHRHKSKRGYVHTGFWRLYKGMKHLALRWLAKRHRGTRLWAPPSCAMKPSFRCTTFEYAALPLAELTRYWQELIEQWRETHGKDSVEEYSVKMRTLAPPLSFGYRHYSQRPYYFLHGRLYHVPEGYSEYSLFHATSDQEDEKPPIHPRGGHNYYNGRDLERFARRIGWLDRVLKKNGDWRELYSAKVAKHERKHLRTNRTLPETS